jgi:hypothetical protein
MAISDKEQKELGKVIRPGIAMLNKPTPQWMKYILRTVLYLSAVWAFLAPTITELSAEQLNTINMWLLRINGLLSVTIKFWGWTYEEN